jgi:hypothetical protein
MGIISKACFFPRFHLRIIEQDERSLIDISSEYIAAIKKKDYYLYCLTLNLFCDYNELQFASIFVCLFLQMTNPTMSPPTSIGVASYLLLYFYLVIYLGIIAM